MMSDTILSDHKASEKHRKNMEYWRSKQASLESNRSRAPWAILNSALARTVALKGGSEGVKGYVVSSKEVATLHHVGPKIKTSGSLQVSHVTPTWEGDFFLHCEQHQEGTYRVTFISL